MSLGLDFIAAARRGTEHSRRCVWPGTDKEFVMRVLTCDEKLFARANTDRQMKSSGIERDLIGMDAQEEELTLQFLAISCRNPEDESKPLFDSPEQMRKALHGRELRELSFEYSSLIADYDPDFEDLTSEDVDAILEQVKKKDVNQLRGFGSKRLASYIITMEKPPLT